MRRIALLCLLTLVGCADPGGNDGGAGGGSGGSGGSCTQASCATGQFCNTSTGQCATGCDEAADCTSPLVCDLATNACVCAPGTHLCGTACLPDTSVQSCGTSCSPCPTDPNGTATCSAGSCGMMCNANALSCANTCAPCAAGTATGICNGVSCETSTCQTGRLLCSGQCPTCPTGSATTQCNGTNCEATACSTGTLLCGGQCPTCPAGASATACNITQCVATACNSGTLLCGGQCPTCPAQASATTCAGTTCAATACNAGYAVCAGQCVPCAAGQLFCCKEVVDPQSGSGPDHAIAIDATGRVHVAYVSGNSLRLARSGPAGFTLATIDNNGGVGKNVSLAVDAVGNAHIAYSKEQSPESVKYAYVPLTGTPTLETVESNILVIGRTAIGLDSTGAVHIAYYALGDAHYATRRGNGWFARYAMEDGQQVSMALFNDAPQLVANANASSGVVVTVLSYGAFDAGAPDGGVFVERTVNSVVGASAFHEATIAVDGAGVPFVAYTDPNFRDLRLAVLDGGNWSKSTVFNGLTGDAWIQMSSTGPRIAFNGTPGTGAVTYRPRYAELVDGGWNFTVIDNKDITVGTLRMVLDAQGRPHVTEYDPDPAIRKVFYIH
jgi:hypothetical protein